MDYGNFIYDGGAIDANAKIWLDPIGYEKVLALKRIMLVVQHTGIELAISEHSLSEVVAKEDVPYLKWAYEMLDYWRGCLSAYEQNPFGGTGIEPANKINNRSFGYLGQGDRTLLHDALLLECQVFLTMENRLPKNAGHILRELGIQIMQPIQLWECIQPL